MKLLTIIPARSGSKGIKNKNLTNFLGKPLINYSINFAKKLKNNTTIVCTDSKIIQSIAKKNLKFNDYSRPKRLSRDNTLLNNTLYHTVVWAIKKKIEFDSILILQPTSPLRDIKDLNKILKYFHKKKDSQSLCSVIKMRTHPAECVVLSKKKWSFIINEKRGLRQKYKDKHYFIDGSYYLLKKNFFLKKKRIISDTNIFFPISLNYPIDIDDKIDLKVAEIVYKNYYEKKNSNNI